jgi:hypothetical protein
MHINYGYYIIINKNSEVKMNDFPTVGKKDKDYHAVKETVGESKKVSNELNTIREQSLVALQDVETVVHLKTSYDIKKVNTEQEKANFLSQIAVQQEACKTMRTPANLALLKLYLDLYDQYIDSQGLFARIGAFFSKWLIGSTAGNAEKFYDEKYAGLKHDITISSRDQQKITDSLVNVYKMVYFGRVKDENINPLVASCYGEPASVKDLFLPGTGTYTGEILYGAPEGFGKMTLEEKTAFQKGTVYLGEWIDGKPSGEGTVWFLPKNNEEPHSFKAIYKNGAFKGKLEEKIPLEYVENHVVEDLGFYTGYMTKGENPEMHGEGTFTFLNPEDGGQSGVFEHGHLTFGNVFIKNEFDKIEPKVEINSYRNSSKNQTTENLEDRFPHEKRIIVEIEERRSDSTLPSERLVETDDVFDDLIEKHFEGNQVVEKEVEIERIQGNYTGQVDDQERPNGKGTFTSTDGIRYEGRFDHGRFGNVTIPSFNVPYHGGSYSGVWKKDVKHGHEEPHGQGTLTWLNGQKHVGIFHTGAIREGEITLSDGTKMSTIGDEAKSVGIKFGEPFKPGRFNRQGKLTGEGLIRRKDGSIERGNFYDGKLHGYGEIIDGQGKMVAQGKFEDGRFIVGESVEGNQFIPKKGGFFNKNGLQGNGIMCLPDGNIFDGMFSDGKLVKGTMWKLDGTMYENCRQISEVSVQGVAGKYIGQTVKGKPHGEGVFESSDGFMKCEGEFAERNNLINLKNGTLFRSKLKEKYTFKNFEPGL